VIIYLLVSDVPIQISLSAVAAGFFNIIAVWLFGKSVKVGLAQSMLLLPFSTAVTIGLSAVWLGEWALLDPRTETGVLMIVGVLCVCAAVYLFGRGKKESIGIHWNLLAGLFVLVSGLMNFFITYFAVAGPDTHTFLSSWYSGCLLGAWLLCGITRTWPRPIYLKQVLFSLGLGVGTVVSMWGTYTALTRIPATLFFPIFSFCYVLGTILVAIFVLKEWNAFGTRERVALLLGSVGALLCIVVSAIA
jgi:drug/metabolite transporter (DMT)-like permease